VLVTHHLEAHHKEMMVLLEHLLRLVVVVQVR
jgi:hypothetical protein